MTTPLFDRLKSFLVQTRVLWLVCLLLNIITFLFIYFKIRPGIKPLALHYNVLIGVEWYGTGRNLYFIPAIGLAIILINFILYRAFKKTPDFLSGLTVLVSLFVQIILLAAVMFLAKVN